MLVLLDTDWLSEFIFYQIMYLLSFDANLTVE